MLLDLEPLLVERLEGIPGMLGVYGAAEFSGLEKAGKPSPCAYVLYGGYGVAQSSDTGDRARVVDNWLVVLSLKNASRVPGADPVRKEAAQMVRAVIEHVMGWQPELNSYKTFKLAPAPRPEPSPARLLFPLAFTIEHVVQGVE